MLSDQEKKGVLSFIGYGSPSAPLWFIGAEEGLGGKMLDDEVQQNLSARSHWDEFMDLRGAHLTLTENGRPIDVGVKQRGRGSQTVWLWMSRIARAYQGDHNDWCDREKARTFMQNWLGRAGAKFVDVPTPKPVETFLTELSPVPEKKTGSPRWVAQFATEDCHALVATRTTRIQDLLRLNRPSVVICYGKRREAEFARLLGVDDWIEVAKGVCKAPSKNVFLLPFFGNGQIYEALVQGLVSYPSFHKGR